MISIVPMCAITPTSSIARPVLVQKPVVTLEVPLVVAIHRVSTVAVADPGVHLTALALVGGIAVISTTQPMIISANSKSEKERCMPIARCACVNTVVIRKMVMWFPKPKMSGARTSPAVVRPRSVSAERARLRDTERRAVVQVPPHRAAEGRCMPAASSWLPVACPAGGAAAPRLGLPHGVVDQRRASPAPRSREIQPATFPRLPSAHPTTTPNASSILQRTAASDDGLPSGAIRAVVMQRAGRESALTILRGPCHRLLIVPPCCVRM